MINMKLTKLKYFLLLATGLVFQNLSAQDIVQDTVPANDSGRFVQIIKADVFRRIKQDSTGDLNVLVGKVVMKQNKTLIYCDSAIQNVKINQVEAFGNIHINDADSVHTYSQYLKYQGDTKIAELKKKSKDDRWQRRTHHRSTGV